MKPIKLLDLKSEHFRIKDEIESAILKVTEEGDFIRGRIVSEFERNLGDYLGGYVVGVGNGTDALTISVMALGLVAGDEVILPSFTYYATAEALALLGIVPVFVDLAPNSFTIRAEEISNAITDKTRAVIVVHLYGEPVELFDIKRVCKENGLFLIEDAAQAIGASLILDGKKQMASTIGDVGILSFYPGKNLGAFGDAGAIVTQNEKLVEKIRMLGNHGQVEKYTHLIVGMNSRLDSIQAAVLNVKLKYLESKNIRRMEVATFYSKSLEECPNLIMPSYGCNKTHIFHQFTIRVKAGLRDSLKEYLEFQMIPTRIYYPKPVHKQQGMITKMRVFDNCDNTEATSLEILSLPIHPELDQEQLNYIVQHINEFMKNN